MRVKVRERKRKAVVNPNQGRHAFAQPIPQPFIKFAPLPMAQRATRRADSLRLGVGSGMRNKHLQALEARLRRLCAGVVNANETLKHVCDHDGQKMVEAAGIEPASRPRTTLSVYMCSQ